MFKKWKEHRKFRHELQTWEKEMSTVEEVNDNTKISKLRDKINGRKMKLSALDTDRLLKKMNKLGIEVPVQKEWWWNDIDYVGPDEFQYYLTDFGKASVLKLIKEERRRNTEWWVKTVVTVILALTGLIGSIIGILSVLNK